MIKNKKDAFRRFFCAFCRLIKLSYIVLNCQIKQNGVRLHLNNKNHNNPEL
jgi:hypothetical protein